MQDLFHFKQFSVNQAGCGMKVNTDGVLLAALADADEPQKIIDIGTGTGLIALMLAQRFASAEILAIEIDTQASQVAEANFRSSRFAERLQCYSSSFQDFSRTNSAFKCDLIISNPPFFTRSLKNSDKQKQVARHAEEDLFESLVSFAAKHLTQRGTFQLILPLDAAATISSFARNVGLYPMRVTNVLSSAEKQPHRQILTLGWTQVDPKLSRFIIYSREKQYSKEYREALREFLTIF